MTNFQIYKLNFSQVRFGNGDVDSTTPTLFADSLVSALYNEALNQGKSTFEELHGYLHNGDLLLSDGQPYLEETLFVPKPYVTVKAVENNVEDSKNKKLAKSLTHIPYESLDNFISGQANLEELSAFVAAIGIDSLDTKVNKFSAFDAPKPYRSAYFSFAENAGLWIFVRATEKAQNLVDGLLNSLAFSGIGGGRSRGLGQFSVQKITAPNQLLESVKSPEKYAKTLTLSSSLPGDNEDLSLVLKESSHRLVKRSGFVFSTSYAESPLRKRDIYKFAAGSVFHSMYQGDIFDVSNGGSHPVWSYAKAFWLGFGGLKEI